MIKRCYYVQNNIVIGLDFRNKPTEIKCFNLPFAMPVIRTSHIIRIMLSVGTPNPLPHEVSMKIRVYAAAVSLTAMMLTVL